jgi:DNA segregation ATPase FtsK/SpoIIIE, S-DNA-T family
VASSTKTPSRPRSGSSTGTRGGSKTGAKGGTKGGTTRNGSRSNASRTTTKVAATKGGKGGKGTGGDGPGPVGRAGRAFAAHLGEQKQDVVGISLVLLGVLAGLGMYAGAGGPVGDFLEAVARGLLGLAGYLVPPLIAWFGLLVVLGRPSPDVGRIAVGSVLLGLGVLTSWHLIAGSPVPADGIRALWPAAGLLGWAIATPLVAALSVWGASAVCVALLFLGTLIVTKTPFSHVVDLLRPTPRGPDEDVEVDHEPAPRAARGRRTAPADDDPDVTRPIDRVDDDPTPVRATLSRLTGEQLALEGEADDGDGLSDADREAGKTPDPPVSRAKMPVDPATRKATKVAPVRSWDDYTLPALDLLATGRSMGKESRRTIEAQVEALQETFRQFNIDATVARWSRGPTVTRFEIELGPGVQVKKVANMGDDIAYALAAPDVRIVAPIPGKSAIGVEVPNRQRDLITLGDILRSDEANRDPHPLTVALGVDIAGNPALVNLATMPHLLISGATGSGKSVTVNGMITSIIMRARPDQVRMILIDPKRVELVPYEGAPHLLTQVVTDPRRATDAVQWCVKEMEQRYELLALLGYRNIDGYNEAVDAGEIEPRPGPDGTLLESERLPYIVLVIDELADLMLVAPRDVEEAICRIAQKARAVGIHMVLATQRPSVDVITGLIKANVPSRLALAVSSQTDSRTIIDMNGAEKLVGKGDMLFLPASQGKPSRLQGCWVTEREVEAAVGFCKAQRQAEFMPEVTKEGDAAAQIDAARSGDDDSDEALLRRAAEQVVVSGLGSTSMLQRKLRIGFARAGRLMDELEVLGSEDGARPATAHRRVARAGRGQRPRLHRVRPGGTPDGRARGARHRRPERGEQGPRRAVEPRGPRRGDVEREHLAPRPGRRQRRGAARERSPARDGRGGPAGPPPSRTGSSGISAPAELAGGLGPLAAELTGGGDRPPERDDPEEAEDHQTDPVPGGLGQLDLAAALLLLGLGRPGLLGLLGALVDHVLGSERRGRCQRQREEGRGSQAGEPGARSGQGEAGGGRHRRGE